MKNILVSALKGAACLGALACCLVSTPAKADVIVRVPEVRVVHPHARIFAPPPVMYREQPVGFWYGGRWQGPIVAGEGRGFREHGWHDRYGRRGHDERRGEWGGRGHEEHGQSGGRGHEQRGEPGGGGHEQHGESGGHQRR